MATKARWSDVKQYVRARGPDETGAAWLLNDEGEERRASVVRNCVCGMLCVLAAVAVSALLGSALLGASTSSSHMELVLQHVKQAAVVEFTVAFKPESNSEALEKHLQHQKKLRMRRRTRKKETAPVRPAESQLQSHDPSVVKVSGKLIPRISEDSGWLRFDGWIQIETNASQVHELVLANHRGYRTICELPSMKTVSEGCLSTEDIPPLHALEAIPHSAFRAEEFSAFGVNCTVGKPIEMLFVGVPFVFCAGEEVAQQDSAQSAVSILLAVEEADTFPKTLAFHGERVIIQANLVGKKSANNNNSKTGNRTLSALEGGESGSEAEEIQLEATTTLWRKKAKSVPASCPYLEAPLTSGREKKSFLYHLLPSR